MELGILGPLFVRVGNVVIAPSAPKLRKVLAMLVTHSNQMVPVSSLMRELWNDDPPVSWLTTLQTYILNLRKLFASVTGLTSEEISRDVLVTRSGGYLLRIRDEELDVCRYRVLLAAGREALSAGDDAGAVQYLDDALRLWRGPALVDVQAGAILESKRRQYEESRLVVLESLIDAQLRQGKYREILTELVVLTAQNPLHEGLLAQYMRALYFNDRRAEALEVFRQLREKLVTELGIEPGPAIQSLHQAILNSYTGLEAQIRIERSPGHMTRTTDRGTVRAY